MGSSRSNFNALAMKMGLVPSAIPKPATSLPGKLPEKAKRNKFGAVKVQIDGIWFDSKKEGRDYITFKQLKLSGAIKDFELKKRWEFYHNDVKIGHYTCDFYVFNNDGTTTVYDSKGGKATRTEAFAIRMKLMKAFYGIDVKLI